MDTFNVKRRDLLDYEGYLKWVKEGGASKRIEFKDYPKILKGYQHEIDRGENFKHPHYDYTYRSIIGSSKGRHKADTPKYTEFDSKVEGTFKPEEDKRKLPGMQSWNNGKFAVKESTYFKTKEDMIDFLISMHEDTDFYHSNINLFNDLYARLNELGYIDDNVKESLKKLDYKDLEYFSSKWFAASKGERTDESVKIAKQKYLETNLIPEDIFNQLVSIDPSKTKKYLPFMGKSYLEGIGINDIRNKIEEYDALLNKRVVPVEKKDINRFKTFKELYDLVEELNKIKTKSEFERGIKKQADIIVDNSDMFIIVPHTHEASCIYGAGTKWCTTANTNTHWIKYQYSDNVTFYYVDIRSNIIKSKLKTEKSFINRVEKLKRELKPSKIEDLFKVAVVSFPNGKLEAYDAADNIFSSHDLNNFLNIIGFGA